MTTITIQPADRTQETAPTPYIWLALTNGIIQVQPEFNVWPYRNDPSILELYPASQEQVTDQSHYSKTIVDGNLVLGEPTHKKNELNRRIFGEVGNNDRLWSILSDIIPTEDTEENNNRFLTVERERQRSHLVHLIQNCSSAFHSSRWLDDPNHLDFFHSISEKYHSSVFQKHISEELDWNTFTAQQYGDGESFAGKEGLKAFYRTLEILCHQTAPQFPTEFDANWYIKNVVWNVGRADGLYPALRPVLEVTQETSGGTVCEAVITSWNLKEPSIQWHLNNVPIQGATEALFDYSGNSGDLKVVVTADNYIGETETVESSAFKIA